MTADISGIAAQVRRSVEERDGDLLADLFAGDGVYELPFGAGAGPVRVEGRERIRAHLTEADRRAAALGIDRVDTVTRELAESGFVIELTVAGAAGASAPYEFASSIGVVTVRDGEISSYRDYPNVLGAAVALRGGVPTARETFERFVSVSEANDWDGLADLYAPDAVVELPFAPAGVPPTTRGREVLRARFRAFGPLRRIESIDRIALHETADPEVVVGEIEIHSRLVESGQRLSSRYLLVVTVRDGLIAHSRDFANPLPATELLETVSGGDPVASD